MRKRKGRRRRKQQSLFAIGQRVSCVTSHDANDCVGARVLTVDTTACRRHRWSRLTLRSLCGRSRGKIKDKKVEAADAGMQPASAFCRRLLLPQRLNLLPALRVAG